MARALAPLAEAGTVLRELFRASQFPPKVVQRRHQVGSKFSLNEPVVAVGVPKYGNQLIRKCCEPNGTSVTFTSGLVEATGLTGGSNACVPTIPIVQAGSCRP